MEPDIVGAPAPTVSQIELDDELTLFDSRTGTALTLNRTASDIWALADGRSTVEEVISTLARAPFGTRSSGTRPTPPATTGPFSAPNGS